MPMSISSTVNRAEYELDHENGEVVPVKLLHRIIGPPKIRRLQLISASGFILALTLISITFFIVYCDVVSVSFNHTTSDVSDFSQKLQFTLRFMLLPATWLMHAILTMVLKRFRTIAWDPMDSEGTEVSKAEQNILTNTVEQTLLSLLSQTILLPLLTPLQVLKVIPTMNILFLVGRISFAIGYPKFRSFGFCFSIIPSVLAIKFVWFELLGINTILANLLVKFRLV